MNTNIVILGCAGTLMVILNEPIGKAFHRANLAMGGRDYGLWSYRAPLIFIGLLLTCLSFFRD